MKLIKTASGKRTIKMSKSEWESIGKTAGWMDNVVNKTKEIFNPDAEGSWFDPVGEPEAGHPIKNWFGAWVEHKKVSDEVPNKPEKCPNPECNAPTENLFWGDEKYIDKNTRKNIWRCNKCKEEWSSNNATQPVSVLQPA